MTTETPSDWETDVVEPFMRVVRQGGFNLLLVLQDIARRSEAFGDGAREMFDELGAEIADRDRSDRAFAKNAGDAVEAHLRKRREETEAMEAQWRVQRGATAPGELGIDVDPPTQTEGETMNPMNDGP